MSRVRLVFLALSAIGLLAGIAAVVEGGTPATTQGAKPRRGEILGVERDAITVVPIVPPADGQPDAPITYTLDENTHIFTSRLIDEGKTPDGKRIRTYQTDRGTREDLKVGLVARIASPDGHRATRVTVMLEDPQATRTRE